MIKSDLHVHTLKSGHAFNTIDECIAKAAELDLEYLGFTDHAPAMEGAPHLGYFEMLLRLPKQINNIKILYGCEANILNLNGDIDITDKLCAQLDCVLAGLHERTPYTGVGIKDNTRAVLNVIKSGKVNIIAHLYRQQFPVDICETVFCAKEYDVILELNKSVLTAAIASKDAALINKLNEMMAFIKKSKAKCIFGSDAHHVSEMSLSNQEWNLFCRVFDISDIELCNNNIELLENMRKG